MSVEPRVIVRCERAARAIAVVAVAVGAAVVLGWVLGLPQLQQLHPAFASMKLNTGLAVVALGGALRSAVSHHAQPRRMLASIALAIAGTTLLEHVLGVDLGIDHLVADPADLGAPGRMSPVTACGLALVAGALLAIESRVAELLAAPAAAVAYIAVLGHLHGAPDLYALGSHASVALHTALVILVLAVGVVIARPERGVMRVLASASPGGTFARQVVPGALAFPTLLALLRQWGERAGLYDTGVGESILVGAYTVILSGLVYKAAAVANRSHVQKLDAESRLAAAEARKSDELREGNARLRVLADVSGAFATVGTDYRALLDRIAGTTAELVGDGCLITLLDADGETLRNVATAHRDPGIEETYRSYIALLGDLKLAGETFSAQVVRTNAPRLVASIDPATVAARIDESLRPFVQRLDIHSFAVVPMRIRGTVAGSLSLIRSRPGAGYTDADVAMLQDLAERAGLAIENARLYGELERRVLERTAELEASNRELEAFAYTVAHDLRAPLRHIDGFSQLLEEDAGHLLGDDDRLQLARIRDAARRMWQLIDDLLRLSRITRAELRRERVDVSELAQTIAGGLRAEAPERETEIAIEPGMFARADRHLVEVALTNLIGNAWKFTRKREPGRIEVAVKRAERPPVFVVRDDGAGFDPAASEKLFAPFQRLHSPREFEGTGVGLATVQRVIHRHGGRIWAESERECGATFYFTLEP